MDQIVSPEHAALAREFRGLVATYEANRDLVLMGAYRPGADPLLDRAIAMHGALSTFLAQRAHDVVPLSASTAELAGLLGHAA